MSVHFTKTVTIDRPVKDVYAFLSDISNEARFWDGVKSSKLVSGKAGEVGAKYERVFTAMGKERKAIVELAAAEPQKRLQAKSAADPVELTGTMKFETAGTGTRLTLEMDAVVHGLAKLASGKIKAGMEANTETSLGRLKALLEMDKPHAKAKK